MPTPVAHSLAGLLFLYETAPKRMGWGEIFFYVFLANAADLDFLAGFLLNAPNKYHHGISHSLGAACLLGVCVGLFLFLLKKRTPVCRGAVAACVYSTHIVLDFFSSDKSLPYGVPGLWPITDEYFISPVSLFSDVVRGKTASSFFGGLFSLHNLYGVLREGIVISVLYVCYKFVRRQPLLPDVFKKK